MKASSFPLTLPSPHSDVKLELHADCGERGHSFAAERMRVSVPLVNQTRHILFISKSDIEYDSAHANCP